MCFIYTTDVPDASVIYTCAVDTSAIRENKAKDFQVTKRSSWPQSEYNTKALRSGQHVAVVKIAAIGTLEP